jgi:hypothetical protein
MPSAMSGAVSSYTSAALALWKSNEHALKRLLFGES